MLIKRYSVDAGVIKGNENGRFVTYVDHEKALKEAREYSEYLIGGIQSDKEHIKGLEDQVNALELAILKILQDKHRHNMDAGPIG